jgi:YVTN family beta-propeller protein
MRAIAPWVQRGVPAVLLAVATTLGSSLPIFAQSVVATIPVPGSPQSIDVNPVTNRIYVSTALNPAASGVSVIDGSSNSVVATIPIPGSSFVGNPIAVNPRTNRIYVAQPGNTFGSVGTISVIDGQTNAISATISGIFAPGPIGIGVNRETDRIYAPLQSRSTYILGVWNGKTNAPVTQVGYIPATLPFREQVAVDPKSNRVYFVDGTVEDSATDRYVRSLPINGAWLAVNPNTNRVYVAVTGSNLVVILDENTNTGAVTVPVGNKPLSLAVNATTNNV